jgi:hypothetical protein
VRDAGQDIDLMLASLRADARDAHAFLQALAVKLEDALPGQINVERHGGLFAREKPVRRIDIDLGEERFSIAEESRGTLVAQRVKVVRGIALKSEQLPVEQWLSALAVELARLAEGSSRAHEALERLLLDRP